MDREIKIGALVLASFAIIGAILAYVMDAKSCAGRWSRSGMNYEFQAFGGCMVQRKDGTWVPEKAIRDINQ